VAPTAAQWPVGVIPLAVAAWVVMLALTGSYDFKRLLKNPARGDSIAAAAVLVTFTFSGVMYFTFRETSRLQVVLFVALATVLIWTGRLLIHQLWSRFGLLRPVRRVIIVGNTGLGRELASALAAAPWTGLQVVGFVDDTPGPGVLGPLDEAAEVVDREEADEVVVALPLERHRDLERLITHLQERVEATLRVIPDVFPLAFARVSVDELAGIPLITLIEPTLSPFQRLVKRGLDLSITSLLLVPALPVMLIIAIAIWIDSGRPILLAQHRVGERGRLFRMYKFRTMVQNADKLLPQVMTFTAEGQPIHKRPDDPRVTRVGRILRRWSLDELPQLFNVIKGDMSLVGPRPELPWLVEKYQPWQRQRFLVPQGLTGWWQINGRSDKPMHLHTEEDLFYIRNYSLWLDIQILLRTPAAIIRRRGAF